MTTDNIEITLALPDSLKQHFSTHSYSSIFVLTDTNTQQHCYPLVAPSLPAHTVLTIKPGEDQKNIYTCVSIWEEMTKQALDRKSLFINLGGGVIGDMGGFAASAYKRGIEFINLPTTLLAQADASVGGKLGIDFQGFKNHIGFFREPAKIFIWPAFLQSLSKNELRSGFAEVIKHSLIGDKAHWEIIKAKAFEEQDMVRHINHAVRFKQSVVKEDPYEKGLRKILNFGHTIGHAVESFFLEKEGKRLLHGEAIAIGMIAEAYLSVKLTGLGQTALEEVSQYLVATYGKIEIEDEIIPELINLTIQDKKNESGKTMMALLSSIGKSEYDCVVSSSEIEEALRYYIQK